MPKLDPEEPTVAIAVFGKQVEDFLQSEIGDYLLKYAVQEEQEGVEALIGAKEGPIADAARSQIWRARSFQTWLGHAVEAGLQAIALMKEDANE